MVGLDKLLEMLDLLEFKDQSLRDICFKMNEAIYKLGIPYVTSRTGNDELLFFTERDKNFYNILIDDDGDIAYMYISNKRKETDVKYYERDSKEFDYDKIAKRLIPL